MRRNLAERFVAHAGEFGIGRDEILPEFPRQYLPKRFEISHLDQIFTFIFIVGESLTGETAVERYPHDYVLNAPAHVWLNVILSLDKYLASFHCDEGVCPNPKHARAVAIQEVMPDKDLLLSFNLLLGRAIDVTRVAARPNSVYLAKAHLLTANTQYSTLDDPLPYLCNITRGK